MDKVNERIPYLFEMTQGPKDPVLEMPWSCPMTRPPETETVVLFRFHVFGSPGGFGWFVLLGESPTILPFFWDMFWEF